MNTDILQQDIQSLLEYFAKSMYKAKDSENGTMAHEIMEKCTLLMKYDYNIIEIANTNGELSSHYPSQILIPEYELNNKMNSTINGFIPATSSTSSSTVSSLGGNGVTVLGANGSSVTTQQQQQPLPQTRQQQTIYESIYDVNKLRDLINKARFARCRARFPLPVILYKGKYICRSATLSGGPEIYGRSGLDYFFYGLDTAPTKPNTINEPDAFEAQESYQDEQSFGDDLKEKNCDWQLFDRVRSQDIKLLKTLNIGTIVDFMVEKKKVKFGMNVTSSEKVDKEKRYSNFTIISLPYPGCEFFREYRDNNYSGEGLVFDWSQTHVDANIDVPDDNLTSQLNIDWDNYKMWDLVSITKNYLKLLIKYLQDNNSGLLIHCISGWDRTPLFVSLLRLSLWADGLIHQQLNPIQILYFTIAYDWYLFGHNLPDRLSKGEEIFFFCFYVLKHLMDDEFSLIGQRYKSKHSSGSSSIGVLRTDSECMLDGILFDGESRGSSISLNSTCSCVSTKSHQDISSIHIFNDENINGNSSWLAHSHDSNSSIGCISTDSSNNGCLNTSQQQQAWSPQPINGKRTSPVQVPITTNHKLRQRNESSSSLSVGSWQMISGTGSLRSSNSTTYCNPNTNTVTTNQTMNAQSHNVGCSNNCNSNNGGLLSEQNNVPTTSSNNINNSQSAINTKNNTLLINNTINSQPQQQQQHQQTATNTANNLQNQLSQESSCCTIIDDDCFSSSTFSNDICFMRRDRLNAVRSLFYHCYCSTIGFKFKNGPDSALGTLLGNFAEKVGLAQRTSV